MNIPREGRGEGRRERGERGKRRDGEKERVWEREREIKDKK